MVRAPKDVLRTTVDNPVLRGSTANSAGWFSGSSSTFKVLVWELLAVTAVPVAAEAVAQEGGPKLQPVSSANTTAEEIPPPKTAEYWVKEGRKLLDERKYEEALALFQKALSINREHCEALFFMGCCHGNMDRHEEALEFLKKAHSLAPDNASVLRELARAFANCDQHKEAVRHYSAVIAGSGEKTHLQMYANRAQSYMALENVDKAYDDYRRVYEAGFQNFLAHIQVAESLQNQGEIQEAIKHYSVILRYKEVPTIRFKRADCNEHLGHSQLAVNDYEPLSKFPLKQVPLPMQEQMQKTVKEAKLRLAWLVSIHAHSRHPLTKPDTEDVEYSAQQAYELAEQTCVYFASDGPVVPYSNHTKDPRELFIFAVCCANAERWEEAEKYIRCAIEVDRNLPEAKRKSYEKFQADIRARKFIKQEQSLIKNVGVAL